MKTFMKTKQKTTNFKCLTTEKAIELFREEIANAYYRLDCFDETGNAQLEVAICNECIDVEYNDLGGGIIEDVQFFFVQKHADEWVVCDGTKGVDITALESAIREQISALYEIRKEEYENEHAYEREQEIEDYLECAYWDMKTDILLGK